MIRIERIDVRILEDRKFRANFMTTLVLSLTVKSPSAGRSKTAPFGTMSFWPLLERPANWPMVSLEPAVLLSLKIVIRRRYF